MRSLFAANRRLPSAVTAHDLAVSCYRDGVTGLAVPVNRFDHVVRCFDVEVCTEQPEVN